MLVVFLCWRDAFRLYVAQGGGDDSTPPDGLWYWPASFGGLCAVALALVASHLL